MPFYSIISSTPTSEDWIPSYVASVGAIVTRHGGKYLARTANFERLEGTGDNPAAFVLIEWPDKEAGVAFMDDPEYRPFLDARLAGSVSHHFLIDGNDAFAAPGD
ncbi:MAG: DUF1330 domain-containing protein [Pseudomonadota bacterium]